MNTEELEAALAIIDNQPIPDKVTKLGSSDSATFSLMWGEASDLDNRLVVRIKGDASRRAEQLQTSFGVVERLFDLTQACVTITYKRKSRLPGWNFNDVHTVDVPYLKTLRDDLDLHHRRVLMSGLIGLLRAGLPAVAKSAP